MNAPRIRTLRLLKILAALIFLGFLCDLAVRPKTGLLVHYFDLHSEGNENPRLSRVESPPFARDFKDVRNLLPGGFRVVYSGALRVKYPGLYWIELGATTGAKACMTLDGTPIAGSNCGGNYPWRGTRELKTGLHKMRIEYTEDAQTSTTQMMSVLWSKEVDATRPIPRDAVYRPGASTWRLTLSQFIRGFIAMALVLAALVGFSLRVAPKRIRIYYFRLAALTLGLLFFLAFAELALRASPYRPREYVSANIWMKYRIHEASTTTNYMGYLPYQIKEFEVPVTMNHVPPHGWRDRDYPIEKAPGVYRILVVGDSYVEAKEVRLEKTFHKLLEKFLNESRPKSIVRYEVIALGKGGSSTEKQREFLMDGLKYDPDLVVLCVFPGNDIRENSNLLNDEFKQWSVNIYKERVIPARIRFIDRWTLFRHSYLNHFLVDHLSDFYVAHIYWFEKGLRKEDLISPDINIYKKGPYDVRWTSAWTNTKNYIKDFRDLTQKGRAELLVMLIHSAQVAAVNEDASKGAAMSVEQPFTILGDFLTQEKIDFLNLAPLLEYGKEQTGQPYSWRYDQHWNEFGHEIAAKALYKAIRKRLEKEPSSAEAWSDGSSKE